MVDKSSCKKKSKKLMKELVKSSATHSSLDRAFDILNFNKSQIKAILKKFNKIGVLHDDLSTMAYISVSL